MGRRQVFEGPHQRVIPGGRLIHSSHVGILHGESSGGGRRIAQRPDVAHRQSGDVHVVVDAVYQFLQVDLRLGHADDSLFLRASRHEAYSAHGH